VAIDRPRRAGGLGQRLRMKSTIRHIDCFTADLREQQLQPADDPGFAAPPFACPSLGKRPRSEEAGRQDGSNPFTVGLLHPSSQQSLSTSVVALAGHAAPLPTGPGNGWRMAALTRMVHGVGGCATRMYVPQRCVVCPAASLPPELCNGVCEYDCSALHAMPSFCCLPSHIQGAIAGFKLGVFLMPCTTYLSAPWLASP
jgi:hypothetical protein